MQFLYPVKETFESIFVSFVYILKNEFYERVEQNDAKHKMQHLMWFCSLQPADIQNFKSCSLNVVPIIRRNFHVNDVSARLECSFWWHIKGALGPSWKDGDLSWWSYLLEAIAYIRRVSEQGTVHPWKAEENFRSFQSNHGTGPGSRLSHSFQTWHSRILEIYRAQCTM